MSTDVALIDVRSDEYWICNTTDIYVYVIDVQSLGGGSQKVTYSQREKHVTKWSAEYTFAGSPGNIFISNADPVDPDIDLVGPTYIAYEQKEQEQAQRLYWVDGHLQLMDKSTAFITMARPYKYE
jgi:hypothetical protein